MNLIYRFPKSDGELWQGDIQDAQAAMQEFTIGGPRKIDALALCAQEVQPPAPAGMLGLRVRLDDKIPTDKAEADDFVRRGMKASKVVAGWVRSGKLVCVCCYAGLNRSGFVAGMTMLRLTTCTGPQVVEMIRAARGPKALGNSFFEGVILALGKVNAGC